MVTNLIYQDIILLIVKYLLFKLLWEKQSIENKKDIIIMRLSLEWIKISKKT